MKCELIKRKLTVEGRVLGDETTCADATKMHRPEAGR